MKVAVYGLGYMGMPTACLLADAGHEVVGIDVSAERVRQINARECPFDEPGMAPLLERAVASGRLKATTRPEAAEVAIIAVPTPEKDHKADLSYVESATAMVAQVLRDGDLIVLESTVSPKTCERVLRPILAGARVRFELAHCPERAIPGNTLHELVHNTRIVGGDDSAVAKRAAALYRTFVKGDIHTTDLLTAECCKLVENSFRDVNIAFANTVAMLGDELGFDPTEVIALANKHPRVEILTPGVGVGGHCIPIDPWFLTEGTKNNQLIVASRETNDRMPAYWAAKIVAQIAELRLAQPRVAVLGVAYKPNVDDARESPAEHLIHHLQKGGCEVKASDPHVKRFPMALTPLAEALAWANFVVIATAHREYDALAFTPLVRCSRPLRVF